MMGDLGFRGVLREEDGTIVIRFPDPEEADLPLGIEAEEIMPDVYLEEEYYEDVDHLVSVVDNRILNIFGHFSRAVNRMVFDDETDEMENFLNELIKNSKTYESVEFDLKEAE